MAGLSWVTVGAAVVLLARVVVAQCSAPATHWVDIWGAMPQPISSDRLPSWSSDDIPESVFANATIRQTVYVSQDADTIRLQFSNAYSASDLPITAVYLALPSTGRSGDSAVQTDTLYAVTFTGGYSNFTIPAGAVAFTDPLGFVVKAQSVLSVTTYLEQGQTVTTTIPITGHADSHTTSYIAPGNLVGAENFTGPEVQTAAHWFFLSTIEAWLPASSSVLVIVGDGTADGHGSTTDGHDRWPDRLLARLQNDTATREVAVVVEAAAGGRLLYDSPGSNGSSCHGALARLDADVTAHSGVRYALVHLGANDIGGTGADLATQQALRRRLAAAYEQIIVRLHRLGIAVLGGTITPFCGGGADSGGSQAEEEEDNGGGGDGEYCEANREASRQSANAWIRDSGRFDGVVDFDAAVRDPGNATRLNPLYDSGDHRHLNVQGYQAMADVIDLSLFSVLSCGIWNIV